jgi:hypothetical protein
MSWKEQVFLMFCTLSVYHVQQNALCLSKVSNSVKTYCQRHEMNLVCWTSICGVYCGHGNTPLRITVSASSLYGSPSYSAFRVCSQLFFPRFLASYLFSSFSTILEEKKVPQTFFSDVFWEERDRECFPGQVKHSLKTPGPLNHGLRYAWYEFPWRQHLFCVDRLVYMGWCH